MQSYRFAVVIERDADGDFAFCPQLQGCYTQGNSYEEALSNIKDAHSFNEVAGEHASFLAALVTLL